MQNAPRRITLTLTEEDLFLLRDTLVEIIHELDREIDVIDQELQSGTDRLPIKD